LKKERARSGHSGAKKRHCILLLEPEKNTFGHSGGYYPDWNCIWCITGELHLLKTLPLSFITFLFWLPMPIHWQWSLVVGLITYFSIIIGELVPKTMALNNPETIAYIFIPIDAHGGDCCLPYSMAPQHFNKDGNQAIRH
jgi:hypothetical protein